MSSPAAGVGHATDPGELRAFPRSARAVLGAVGGAVVGVAAVWFALSTDGFATVDNLEAILLAGAFVGILAMGQTLIMVSGSFVSMSLGTQTAVCAMLFLWSLKLGLPVALVLTVVVGALLSGLQGFVVGAWQASPIIVTIAASVVMQGVAVLLSDGSTVTPPTGAPSLDVLVDPIAGVAAAAYAMLLVTLVAELWLRRTRLGATTYLVGSSRASARAAGLPVTLIVTVVFALAGTFAAVAGIFLGSFQQSASLSLEGTLTFDAIAAVLIGGAAVSGGRGSAVATLFGALAISAIGSVLLLRDYSTGVQILVKGVVLLGAVVGVHAWSRRRVVR